MDGNFLFLTGGRLFFFIFAGILLAWAFQKLSAFVFLALGITGLGRPPANTEYHGNPAHGAAKPASALGLWSLIGVSLSLFAATYLVSSLVRFGSHREILILSLSVWAGFLFLVLRIEASAPGPLGHLLALAAAERRDAFAETAAWEGADGVSEIAAQVRQEFRGKGGDAGLREKLGALAATLPAQEADRFEIDREAEDLFRDEEIRGMARRGELLRVERNRFRETVAGRADITAEESGRWADALHARWNRLRDEAEQAREAEIPVPAAGAAGQDAMAAGTAALLAEAGQRAPEAGKVTAKVLEGKDGIAAAGAEPAHASGSPVSVSACFRDRLQAFKGFLGDADRRELNPVRLEEEVERLVGRPEADALEDEAVEKGVRALKKDDVIHVLKQRKDISPQEADSLADLVDSARTRALSRTEMREHRRQEATDKAIARLRDRLYALERPERDYESFRKEVERLLRDPAVFPSLAYEAPDLDGKALADVFSAQAGISRQDAERMAESADQALRLAREAAQEMAAETARRAEEARIGILAREEAIRTRSRSAARWLSGLWVASGAAAALGGWMAVRG